MGRRGRRNLTEERLYFVTTTVVKFTPIFEDEKHCEILLNNIKHYQEKYHFIILGYVIMPSHFHWIVEVNPEYGTISEIMRDIKKFTAWQIFDLLEEEQLSWCCNSSQVKGESPKYNEIFTQEAEGIKDQSRKLWMPRFDDEVIRNEKMFWVKLKYIHNNPVKSGLVEKATDYKYSSARNYKQNNQSAIFVDTTLAGVEIV